jgi:hypothetical protein
MPIPELKNERREICAEFSACKYNSSGPDPPFSQWAKCVSQFTGVNNVAIFLLYQHQSVRVAIAVVVKVSCMEELHFIPPDPRSDRLCQGRNWLASSRARPARLRQNHAVANCMTNHLLPSNQHRPI